MHKFYWRNTHGPGARNQTECHHYNPRLGKSGSADNILSEGSSSASYSSHTGSDDLYEHQHQQARTGQNEGGIVARIRRMSGRNSRPKSVADMDDLTRNLHNVRMTNSQAQEYASIEHLEAAQYAQSQTYSRPQYQTYAQVRNSKSLYFNNDETKSRTWNQQDTRQYRTQNQNIAHHHHSGSEYYPGHQKRLSVSSFKYKDRNLHGSCQSPGLDHSNTLPQKFSFKDVGHQHQPRDRFRDKVQRSLSCERSRHARQMVKTFKISSDRFQENFTKLSSNINNKLDSRLSTLNCVASEENDNKNVTDWYKPSTNNHDLYDDNENDNEDDDRSAGFLTAPSQVSQLTTPTTSLGPPLHHHLESNNLKDIKSPSLSVFSCTEPQHEDMANVRRLSHTMRGKMHSANKKLSMIRSKSMERFSKKQEMILVTPRTKQIETENTADYSGPYIGKAVAVIDFTPNPYDREALRLRRGDIIDVIETNPNGTWRGHCNGRIGNFKFLNVETIPSRAVRTRDNNAEEQETGPVTRMTSVQELLTQLNLEQYLSVFILNGYDSLDSLYKVDQPTLEYFGIVDTRQQRELLVAIQTLLNGDQMLDRDSGVYSVGFDTSSESGFSEEYPGDGERGRLGRGRSGRARAIRVAEPEDVLQGLS